MHLHALALSVCCAPFLLAAQSLTIGPNGTQVSDGRSEVLAPAPIRVGQELLMSELPVAQSPATFFLNYGTRGRAGPFELAEGATVGSPQNPFVLHMVDHGLRFTLQPAQTNAVCGPFTATNGAPVTVGNSLMTLVRPAPKLRVSLTHANRVAQTPVICIAPYDNTVIQALYELRAKYVALANRVNNDTADVKLEGVPRIHSGFTGNTFSPVVKASSRDKQNVTKGAELSAMVFLDKVLSQHFRIRSQAITDGSTYHFQMPPGDYVLCATQRIKDPRTPSTPGTLTAVWWTPFRFDGEHPLSLNLTADNAISWREIFSFK
mgnify:CR=1 FL=1